MHLPDGFISVPVAATTGVIAVTAIAVAVRVTNKKIGEKQVPMMGVLAAFIFAAQMLNFPVAGGTSGHFVGAALAAILLGPWTAVLIMSSVLVVQCVIFQDGGLLALGANITNMAIVSVFISYYIYKGIYLMFGKSRTGLLAGAGIGAWFSVVFAALACAFELVISGTSPWEIAIPAMGGIHMIIGVGEALITVAVLSLVMATRSDLLKLQVT
ncbi:MAG: energy-coupling factor ABC transporter permease [Dehalococcoidia bacterium]|nr:energy-coupling factor ABC transporter permease [Dehalococcoidia bacterium]MDD5495136.1 energy-coupling factor ABC transporter permease [Dehalococcoidia bacterium]